MRSSLSETEREQCDSEESLEGVLDGGVFHRSFVGSPPLSAIFVFQAPRRFNHP
jgi:hypothetical protein